MRFAQEISIFNPKAIELAVTDLGTKITQTASELRLEATKTLANYSTTAQMESAITIKANQITSEVSETYATQSAVNGHVTDLSSKITQNTEDITAEVKRATKGEGELSSRIQQTATSISFSVTNPTASGNSAKLEMSYKKENGTEVKLSAQNITFTGMVKFVDLKDDKRGSTVINGNNISTGSIHDANNNTVFNLSDGTLTMKKGSITLGSTPSASAKGFKVESDGTLKASSATIWGTVHATAGEIGGLTLNNGKLYTNNKSTRDSATTGVYIASDGIALGNTASTSNQGFKVDSAGNVNVYGGSISAGAISGGTISGATISGTTITGSTFTATAGQYGEIRIGNSIMEVPWIDFVSRGVKYCAIAIDGNTAHNNPNNHRLITGYGIHVGGGGESCWSWFEDKVLFGGGREDISDRRSKDAITPLDDERARQLVLNLSPVTFHYKVDKTQKQKHHGFIAQDIRALGILDTNEIVSGDESKEMLGICYEDLIADVVAVIQSQERRIAALEGRTDG